MILNCLKFVRYFTISQVFLGIFLFLRNKTSDRKKEENFFGDGERRGYYITKSVFFNEK